MIYFVAA